MPIPMLPVFRTVKIFVEVAIVSRAFEAARVVVAILRSPEIVEVPVTLKSWVDETQVKLESDANVELVVQKVI